MPNNLITSSSIVYLMLLCAGYSCVKQNDTSLNSNTTNHNIELLFKDVIEHYSNFNSDTLKIEAAIFLRDNLKWHKLPLTINHTPEYIDKLIGGADSVYSYITKGVNNEILESGAMTSWLNYRSRKYSMWRDSTFIFPNEKPLFCLNSINAHFIINHIDNAFDRWHTSPYSQGLSFEHFCEYILPFVALNNGNYLLNGAELYAMFSDKLEATHPKTIQNLISRYSHYIRYMREFTNTNQQLHDYNWKEIFFKKDRDCIPVCEIECNVLRAMGVPVAIDMNIGNREYVGQHYHCVAFDKKLRPLPFHGEGQISKEGFSGYITEYKLNIYRFCYASQSDSPYMLKGENEGLPDFFNTPTIKDVTEYIKPTVTQKISLKGMTNVNLTWLYSYSREEKIGARAITWGINDTTTNTVTFNNIVQNMIYFPAFVDINNKANFISEPIVVMKGLNYNEVLINDISDYCINRDSISDIVISRKFPRKPNMINEAKKLIGGIWYGSQYRDGRDKVKLAEIDFMPDAHLQEIKITRPQPYKFYIYESSNDVISKLGEVEFITDIKFGYKNIEPATPLPILSPKEIKNKFTERFKLLPKNSRDKAFDGNQQTAVYGRRWVCEFNESQIVTSIVFAPINAENSIEPNENYQLFQWNNGWQEIANVTSMYHFVEFKNLDTQKLYWLKNNSRGHEEVPFIIIDGKPKFVYYESVLPPVKRDYNILSTIDYICTASSEEPAEGPYESGFVKHLTDADTTNIWHSRYTGVCPNYPHWIKYDTRFTQQVDGIIIKLRPHANKPKTIKVSTSTDSVNWKERGIFELRNTANRQEIFFKESLEMRYINVVLLEGQNKEPHSAMIYLKLFNYK